MSLTLAFDTSQAHVCASLLTTDQVGQTTSLAAHFEPMAKGQAEALLPILESLLQQAGCAWGDVTRLGVGAGPGNFTGIRIAVSAANGLAQGLGIPVHGVSVLEAMAFGHPGLRLASLDARQDRLYLQVVAQNEEPPFLANLSDLPELAAPLCIGHEAHTLAAHYQGRVASPTASISEAIARLSMSKPESTSFATPLYVRPADAAPPKEPPPSIRP
ncbi:MAG: tRNA (adenosine(37)-N6)-threonylcarbamoyltransferase complex dimerization subunit type 1 TsaB [Pseudomonadota bacterium]